MILFRIQTEDKNRESIEELISDFFDGFTILSGTGYWKSDKEDTLVIEVIGPEDIRANIEHCADIIRKSNNQECVLVTEQPITTKFV